MLGRKHICRADDQWVYYRTKRNLVGFRPSTLLQKDRITTQHSAAALRGPRWTSAAVVHAKMSSPSPLCSSGAAVGAMVPAHGAAATLDCVRRVATTRKQGPVLLDGESRTLLGCLMSMQLHTLKEQRQRWRTRYFMKDRQTCFFAFYLVSRADLPPAILHSFAVHTFV